MIKKFDNFLNEGKKEDFKIGDEVICNGRMDNINFNGEIGIITNIKCNSNYATVKFPTRFDDHLHQGNNDKTNSSYDIRFEYLSSADPETQQRLLKKKEEMRIKMMDVDPYGEEDWNDD